MRKNVAHLKINTNPKRVEKSLENTDFLTAEGITIKPDYTPKDIENLEDVN